MAGLLGHIQNFNRSLIINRVCGIYAKPYCVIITYEQYGGVDLTLPKFLWSWLFRWRPAILLQAERDERQSSASDWGGDCNRDLTQRLRGRLPKPATDRLPRTTTAPGLYL